MSENNNLTSSLLGGKKYRKKRSSKRVAKRVKRSTKRVKRTKSNKMARSRRRR